MELSGTIRGGTVVLDTPASFPDGTRVVVYHAPPPYDREAELAILRESIEDMAAGRGVDFYEFMDQLAAEMGFEPLPPR
jgi:hypothetical protein